MATRALLFDLDGTIWRGHEWYAAVLREVIGTDESTTLERLAMGASVFRLAKEAGLSKSRLISACCSRVDALMLYNGVLDSLARLSMAEWKLGIVTSLSERIAQPALTNLGLDPFFGAKRFAARKPSPSPLRAALGDLGEIANPRHYYVGDTSSDAECAARAGLNFVWASYGYGIVEPSKPARVLGQFGDLLSL